MAELSDETLMAYADNVLAKAERAEVKAILDANPELMAKVRQFERTGIPIQRLFDDKLSEPLPASLMNLVRGHQTPSVAAPVSDLAAARQAKTNSDRQVHGAKGGRDRHLSWTALALAASVCAVIGTGAGWFAHATVDSGRAQQRTAALLQIALEQVPGDREVALPNGAAGIVRVKPAVTFHDKSNRFCRQYRLTGDALPEAEGLACRTQSGTWQVLAQAERGKSTIQPAGAKDSQSIAATVERMMVGDYLVAERELELIARNWKP